MKLWQIFVLGAVLSWGSYVPLMHQGQALLKGGALRAFLCVGMAYFVTAVVVPLALLLAGVGLERWGADLVGQAVCDRIDEHGAVKIASQMTLVLETGDQQIGAVVAVEERTQRLDPRQQAHQIVLGACSHDSGDEVVAHALIAQHLCDDIAGVYLHGGPHISLFVTRYLYSN